MDEISESKIISLWCCVCMLFHLFLLIQFFSCNHAKMKLAVMWCVCEWRGKKEVLGAVISNESENQIFFCCFLRVHKTYHYYLFCVYEKIYAATFMIFWALVRYRLMDDFIVTRNYEAFVGFFPLKMFLRGCWVSLLNFILKSWVIIRIWVWFFRVENCHS